MDIGSLFLVLAVFVLVALYIARPLFQQTAVSVSEREHRLSSLMAERDRVLDALQELDFDYQLGKIPEEEYPTQRLSLLTQGAEILKQIDALQPNGTTRDMDAALEAALAERKAARRRGERPSPQPQPTSAADDELEAIIAARRRAHKEKIVGFCPQCGQPVQQSDIFCSKCGTTLR